MDNKIKYVDLNGLKVFAEALKQDLKNHVLELGLYQELLHRIENLELYKIVDLLPEKGDEDTIYLLKNPSGSGDKNVFIEYLYNNEYEWEEIGNFTPSFDLEDYLKIENAPFEKGSAENSAVLKGEYEGYSNKAISKTSMAVGAATMSGLKGWYYSAIDFTNKKITLSDKPTYILAGTTLINGGWSSGTPNIKVNDVISLVNNSKYDLCSKVTAVNGNVITVNSLPFTILVIDRGAAASVIAGQFSDGYSLYIPERPDAGIIDFGGGALSEGANTKATNIGSHAEGIQTHAYGQYSHAEGRETKAGYAAHAEGWETVASGEDSHSEGYQTTASGKHAHSEGAKSRAVGPAAHAEGQETVSSGNYSHSEGYQTEASGHQSHAEGQETVASGDYSHAGGLGTKAYNLAEHASGKFNNSIQSTDASKATQFTIGIGTSDNNRKNAFEVRQNGDTYLCIGGQLYFVTPITDDELNELFND